jgi:hypothetical protein
MNHHPSFHYSIIPSFHDGGGKHEEAEKRQSFEGSLEKKKC